MGSDFNESFVPKSRHGYVNALNGNFGLTCVRCALVCIFVMEMDGFGKSKLSSEETLLTLEVLYLYCSLWACKFSTYC